MTRPCPYCGAAMSNPRRVQCGKLECERKHKAKRTRDWMRRHKAETGEQYRDRYPRPRADKKTLDLVTGALAGTVRLEDYGAYRGAVKHDPCAYCSAKTEHLDHIVPRSRGGSNGWDNMTGACADCNRAKRNRTLLGHLLTRSLDLEVAAITAQRNDATELGPAVVPEAERAPKRSARTRRNWRLAA